VDAISETFAKKNHFKIERTPQKTIGLLENNCAKSVGRTIVSFRFRGEKQSYVREFHILRKSVCDIILGRSFLAETQTLTKFSHASLSEYEWGFKNMIFFSFSISPPETDHIRCTVNGVPAATLPNMGSNLILVSGAFAKRHGFKIQRETKYRR